MVCADEKYQCQDGQAVFNDGYFVVLCPPDEEIISRSPSVLSGSPLLSTPTTIGEYRDIYYNQLHSKVYCSIEKAYDIDSCYVYI